MNEVPIGLNGFPSGMMNKEEEDFLTTKLNISLDLLQLLNCGVFNINDDNTELGGAFGPAGGGTNYESNFCSDHFHELGDSYKKVHGYIALVICTFGIFANIMNLIVLTRKDMATPINRMLTALAFADCLVMCEYIPFALHMYIMKSGASPEDHYSKSWAIFVFFHMHFTQILHTISIQLTLTMAIWRFVAIKGSNRSSAFCTFKRCNYCILAAYICPIFLCIPNYLTFAIRTKSDCFLKDEKADVYSCIIQDNCSEAVTIVDLHTVQLSELAKRHDDLLQRIHFWTFSVVIKLIPCVLLTFFMGWLVNFLGKQKCLEHLDYHHIGGGGSIGRDGSGQIVNIRLKDFQNSGSTTCQIQSYDTKTLYKARKHHQKLEKQKHAASLPMNESAKKSTEGDETEGKVKNGGATIDNGGDGDGEVKKSLLKPPSEHHESDIQGGIGGASSTCDGNGDTNSRRESKGFVLSSFRNSKLKRGGSGVKNKRTDRTSRMLIAVLLLFLLTEFPQGIMALLSGIYGHTFFKNCYNTWAEVWDMLALLNSSINFLLYCFMSKQFRTQFRLIFKLNKSRRLIALATCQKCEPLSTTV